MTTPRSVAPGFALEQVGWYCAGGHEGHDGERVQRSLRWDDPCAFGVPVYVVVPAQSAKAGES